MTREWHIATLGEMTQFINGLWKGEDPPFVHVGVIRNTNFTKEGALDDSDIAYLDVEEKKFQKRRLQFGDLILEKSGGGPKQPVGRVVFFDKTDGDFSFSNFTAAIRVVDPTALNARFLHKYLHWVYVSGRTEAMQSHSTGIRNLNGDAYKAINVAHPSLIEQLRIVAILDEAFEGIATAKASAEKNLQKTSELFGLLLNGAFANADQSWRRLTFGDVVTRSRGGVNIKSTDYCNEGVPVLTKGDVKPFGVVEYGGKCVSESDMQVRTWPRSSPGDFIVATRDLKPSAPFLGLVGPVPEDRAYVVNQGATLFAIDESLVDPKYFLHWCSSDRYREHVRSRRVGSTQVHIRQGDLFASPLWLPSMAVQKFIVDMLDDAACETSRLVAVNRRRLSAFDELEKSLLHQAFSGAI